MSDVFNFDDAAPVEILFPFRGKQYVLREGTADAVIKYRNAQARATKLADGKMVGVGDVHDADPLFLSNCLYYATADGKLPLNNDGDPDPRFLVPVQKIRSWPDHVVTPLVKKLKEITRMEEAKETPESLVEQIDLLQQRRQALLAVKETKNGHAGGDEGSEKNSQVATTL